MSVSKTIGYYIESTNKVIHAHELFHGEHKLLIRGHGFVFYLSMTPPGLAGIKIPGLENIVTDRNPGFLQKHHY